MLTNKESLVIQNLLEQSDYCTSKQLAEVMGLSEKTVRQYIKNINAEIEKDGFEIEAKRGFGYLISNDDRSYFEELAKGDNNDDRIYQILYTVFIEDSHCTCESMADNLGVSVSTIRSDLVKIRKVLKKYNLRIDQSLEVQGNEKDVRRFICTYFFDQKEFDLIYKELDTDPELGKEIMMIIIDHCRRNHLTAYDFFARNLVIHIMLSIKRVACGCTIQDTGKLNVNPDMLRIAKGIVEDINGIIQVKLPDEEIGYVAIHLQSNTKRKTKEKEQLSLHLIESTRMFCEIIQIPYYADERFINDLSFHMQALMKRSSNQIQLKNPLTEEIQNKYPAIFEAVSKVYRNDSYFKDVRFTDDEIAYIAIHYLTAIERNQAAKTYTVIVISATGYASSMYLRQRLIKEFGNRLEIKDVASAYDLSNEKLKGVDFIISTVEESEVWWGIPVAHVSLFLDEDDIKEVKRKMREQNYSLTYEAPERLLRRDRFHIFEGPVSKQEVLKTMLKDIVHQTNLDYKTVLKYINYHEDLATSAFCENIAVPHPQFKLDGLEQSVVYVAICKEGVDWDSIFHHIKLVILILPKDYQDETLKMLMKNLVILSEDEMIQEELIASKNYHQFLETIENYMRRNLCKKTN